MQASVRRLKPPDATALMTLRREALETDPLSFAASIEDDVGLSPEFVRNSLGDEREQATFGAFRDEALIGMVGIHRATKLKLRHTATIWGMYVTPRARRTGAGRALLAAAIDCGRQWGLDHVQLAVTESAPAARRLYESAGFVVWGREPRALSWGGRVVDEHHLALDLREPRHR